jgi:hypothetical protein
VIRADTVAAVPQHARKSGLSTANRDFCHGLLGETYRDALWSSYDIPNFSDLCCYWFEKSRFEIHASGRDLRVGLLATQAIRGGSNRIVLERIKKQAHIFLAWSDREWMLDGAAVHTSIIGFSRANSDECQLNGKIVSEIHSDLSTGVNTTLAQELHQNDRIAWIGTKKAGSFDISCSVARSMIADTGNPHGQPNSEVMKPWINGKSVTARNPGEWIVDFGVTRSLSEASMYCAPFAHIERIVKEERSSNKRQTYRERWWLHAETRSGMREAIAACDRVLVTARVSKFRIFGWIAISTLPDDGVFIFARSDDYFFGVLHSSIHELWARRMGTQLREAESGFRYTPTTCFETFALPWSPGSEPSEHASWKRISEAARELDGLRERWLNPPEWLAPIEAAVDAADDFADVPDEARPLIRRSAIMAAAAKDARLKKRTLTNLYNERPTWLKLAHEKLDRAVLSAYAATDPEGGWQEDWAAVWVERGAGQPLAEGHELAAQRAQVDQLVLAALLRLNQSRARR